ncbi:hypothetical protein IFM89_030375 [Coptis chinensis]|uniref:HMG box domain-containing protein n=1 Tax=Coptis chinensis TaxID=261450 RepID=A0A835LC74_9MAGN|nr:hypothetical protein IFM89_030375 [Coptis chinensis]
MGKKKASSSSAQVADKNQYLKQNSPEKMKRTTREDFRGGYQEQNPDVKSMRDVGKACGEKWKTMTYEEKVKYYDIATEKRKEFEQAMADYERRKERGEYQDDLEDSEYDEY